MPREIAKEVPREIPREISRTVPREIPKEMTKNLTKQVPKLVPKLITKQIPRFTTGLIPNLPGRNPPKSPPPLPRFNIKGNSKGLSGMSGFKTFVIKGGKKLILPGIRPKGKALTYGESIAKKTLRATFGVEPSGFVIRQRDIGFTPDVKAFRSYKIRQGKKIPLKDEFIQRRGRRLSSLGEVSEIQAARMMRL